MSSNWEQAGKQKREEVFSLIPKEWIIENPPSRQEQKDVTGPYVQKFLSKEEIAITETDAVGIASQTASGKWKAVDVTKAFCHRAALAHQLTNCLLEIFFDQALERAQELDNYFEKHKKPMGPLHGLPISLKDQFHVKGVETTMGYIGWIGTFEGNKGTGREKKFESELVKELLALGAVLYCKTSVPHTLMSGESENNIMGYVWNPKDRLVSAGGSSGGEGALIGLKGSPLGFGTDIGGSVRIPAAFNGLYGMRPSVGRIPYQGAANSMDGQNTVLSVIGPIAGSVESLQLVMKSIMSQQPWLHDPAVVELPWRDEQEIEMRKILTAKGASGKLAFGFYPDDGVVQPHPPVRRAVKIVEEVLRKLGHDIIEWKPEPAHKALSDIALATWIYDGGADVQNAFDLSGEPKMPMIAAVYPKPIEQMNGSKIAENNVAKREAQKAYMEYWNSTVAQTSTGRPVDAVISPVAPFAAASQYTFSHVGYTGWCNTLDYTSVTLPVTTADKSIDVADANYTPRNNTDRDIHNSYDPERYDGAHVSVQLVGRRLQEEKMLALASYVAGALSQSK